MHAAENGDQEFGIGEEGKRTAWMKGWRSADTGVGAQARKFISKSDMQLPVMKAGQVGKGAAPTWPRQKGEGLVGWQFQYGR